MVASNSSGIRRPKRISSGRKQIKKLTPMKADPTLHKLLDKMDTEQACMGNSNDIPEFTSEEVEQMLQFNATASCIEKHLNENMVDSCKIEETFIEMPLPLAMDPNALVGEEEDIHNPMCEETHAQLKASIKKLKIENSMTCRKIIEMSETCVRLRKENSRLLKQLKKSCTPDTIAYLKSQNPDKKSPGSSEA